MDDYSIHEEELEYDEEEELRLMEEAENDEEEYEDFEEIPPEEFNSILDEHLEGMAKRDKKQKEIDQLKEEYNVFGRTEYEKINPKEDIALQEFIKKAENANENDEGIIESEPEEDNYHVKTSN